jgi:hypothetical protein
MILACLFILAINGPTLAIDHGAISGRVIWEDGYGSISDVLISVHNPQNEIVSQANTDEAGSFRIELPAGPYIVSAEKDNVIREYFPEEYLSKEADIVTVSAGHVSFLQFTLDLGGWISGNFSYYGEDIDFGLVTAIKIDHPNAGWTRSELIEGPFPSAYDLPGLLPGVYKILGRAHGKGTEFYPGVAHIEDAAIVTVVEGAGASDISFMLDPVGWGAVEGRIYNVLDGRGICGASVYAFQWRDYWEDPNLANCRTDEDGSFVMNLPAGEYYVMAIYPRDSGGNPVAQFYYNRYDQFQADILVVSQGETVTGVDFPADYSTPHDLSISGAVISENTGLGLDDVVVTAIDFDTGEIIGSGYTYNEGLFSVDGLSPRRYILMFSGTYIIPFFFYSSENWGDADVITLDRNFAGVRTEAITQDYGNNGLAITGRVFSGDQPVEGARVYAYPFGEARPVTYGRTDAYGDYSIISGLAPGFYTITCDLFGYDHEVFPIPVGVDLLTNPEATDINFDLVRIVTSVQSDVSRPGGIELAGNYPNPFNSQTVISFFSAGTAAVLGRIEIYNLLGQMTGGRDIMIVPGSNKITLDMSEIGSAASSGVYYYRISGSGNLGRMIFLK